MANNMKVLLAGLCFLAAAYHIQAEKDILECWHCSSDTIGAEDFCGTTFNEDALPSDEILKERNISVVRKCNSSIELQHKRSVCRKTVEELEGNTITKRFCYYTNKSDPLEQCDTQATDKNVRRTFCKDCTTDKCNSASQMAAFIGTMFLLLILTKVFAI